MEPAAARRRPTDVVTGARRGPVSLVEVAASGTAARGGRRRPSSFLCRVDGVLVGRVARLYFVRLMLFFWCTLHRGVYPWRSVPRSTETAATVLVQVTQRSEDVRCARSRSICGSR